MELSNPSDLKLEFSDPKTLDISNLTNINIRQGGKPVIIATGKCFSYGVRKDRKYKTESMDLVLDETTVKSLRIRFVPMRKSPRQTRIEILISQRRRVRDRLRQAQNGQGRDPVESYENGNEIDPLKYEGKHCDVKVTLAIEGLVVGNNVNLQAKIHDANVQPKTYEHVRLVDLEW